MNREEEDRDVLLALLNPSSVRPAPSVAITPHIVLVDWCIKQDIQGNRYFVGTEVGLGCGRVSTPIVEFDTASQRGRTRSGRLYELQGSPGRSDDGEYVWSVHKFTRGIQEFQA